MLVDSQAKVSFEADAPISDSPVYRSLVGLSSTSPSPGQTSTQFRCLHMHDPHEPHLSAMKRIHYLQGTLL
jgi:hypothetical protein